MLEWWTNTSSPPSREMKPKPFSLLKNFTVPCMALLSYWTDQRGLPFRELYERNRNNPSWKVLWDVRPMTIVTSRRWRGGFRYRRDGAPIRVDSVGPSRRFPPEPPPSPHHDLRDHGAHRRRHRSDAAGVRRDPRDVRPARRFGRHRAGRHLFLLRARRRP